MDDQASTNLTSQTWENLPLLKSPQSPMLLGEMRKTERLLDRFVSSDRKVRGISFLNLHAREAGGLFSADVYLARQSDSVCLHIARDGTKRSYKVDSNGAIVEVGDIRESSAEEIALRQSLIDAVIDETLHVLRRRTRLDAERQDTRRHWAKVIGIVLACLLILAGAAYGIGFAVYRAGQQAAQMRQDYDAGNPQLPGEGTRIVYQRAAQLPDEAFAAIPYIGGNEDSLASPRRVDLRRQGESSMAACVSLPQFAGAGSLRVVVGQSSPIVDAKFALGVDNNGVPQLCAVRPGVINGHKDSTFAVALQIT